MRVRSVALIVCLNDRSADTMFDVFHLSFAVVIATPDILHAGKQ